MSISICWRSNVSLNMDSGLPAAVALPLRCPPVSDGVLSAEIAIDPANALFKIARRPRQAIVHGPITEEVQINDFQNGIGANHCSHRRRIDPRADARLPHLQIGTNPA